MSDSVIEPAQDLLWHFATPIGVFRWADSGEVNAELRDAILKSKDSADPAFENVVGGWATPKDFLSWDVPCVRQLGAHIRALLTQIVGATTQGPNVPPMSHFGLHAWANILRSGGYHAPHTHPNCYWSGVYYVSVGKADENVRFNGHIELFDPRSAAGGMLIPGSTLKNQCVVKPEPGLAVLFPSWIKHMVHPFHGEGERISVAFNLTRV